MVEHGYDHQISPQALRSPSQRDFVNLLSFLLKLAIPNFKFGADMTVDMPQVMRSLGYPFPVNPSSLKAVEIGRASCRERV